MKRRLNFAQAQWVPLTIHTGPLTARILWSDAEWRLYVQGEARNADVLPLTLAVPFDPPWFVDNNYQTQYPGEVVNAEDLQVALDVVAARGKTP